MYWKGDPMKLLLAAAILGLCAPTSWAQEREKEKKKDVDAPPGKEERKARPGCGKSPHDIAAEMKKNGLGGDDLDESVAKHFKTKHPEGPCHCTCKHEAEEPAPRVKLPPKEGDACGRTVKQVLQSSPRIDENKVAEHFKRHHPKGDPCHCSCGHEAPEGKPKGRPEKGNNGVGNGEDPQPPGKPPVNDGPGSKPGAPDRKGGDKR